MKRIIAAVAALGLGIGLALFGVQAASAHNATLTGVAVCQTDGTYTITWTGDTSNVPADATGTVTVKSHTPPPSKLSADSIAVAANAGFSFTQSGIPGYTNQANVNTDVAWSDGYKQNDVTGHLKLDGDCKPPAHDVTILPVTTSFDCTTGTSYTVPVEPAQVKFDLLSDGVTRPVPGTFPLAAGATIDIKAHVAAEFLVANGGDYNPASYDSGVLTGASTNTLDCHPPVACVVTGGFNSDEGDAAPVLTAEGLDFTGPSTLATDIYQRVTAGNAQGITAISVSYGAGSTGQPAQAVVEISNPSSPTFATLSTNLTAAQAVGTVDVLALPTWSTTKIATGPGSLSDPISYSALVAMFPSNHLLSAPSLHLLSHSTAGDHSVVTGITSSCGSADFVPTKPAATHRTTTVTTDPVCSPTGGGTTTTTVTHFTTPYVWDATSHSYIAGTETVDDGYPQVTTNEVPVGEICPIHASPVNPTVTTVGCGLNQSVVLPDSSETTSYAVTTSTVDGYTVTATPAANVVFDATPGWTINEDGTATISGTYNAVIACITQVQLALTGVNTFTPFLGGLGLLGLGALALLVYGIRRHNAVSTTSTPVE